MNKALRLLAGFFIVLALGVSAVLANGGTPARADTSTPWIYNHWLKAYSGGGCAGWPDVNPGTALVSQACGTFYNNLQYRIITRTNGEQVMQIADVLASVDLTVSGGTWKWEPANSATHVFPIDQGNDGVYLMFQGDHFMGPNGNHLPLKDITPISDEVHAGWAFLNCQDAC